MTARIEDSFNRVADRYDGMRRKLIPCYDDFYGTAVDLLAGLPGPAPRILDLGAGTGLLAAAIRVRYPLARLTLVDLARDMMAVARERFAGDDRVDFRIADYAATDLQDLNDDHQPWDAIVSGLSIHHLEHPAKQALFAKIVGALAPGGRFINADQVAGPTPALEALYQDTWVRQIKAAGVSDGEVAAAKDRKTFDRLAPLFDQLVWMTQAGLVQVHSAYQFWSFVVFAGDRKAD